MMKLEKEIQQKKFHNEYQKLMLNIIFTGNYINYTSIKLLKPFGISPQQYNVLRILRGQHPKAISVNQIAGRMLDKNSNASRLIDKLVLKKIVVRKISITDRRQMDILITDEGLKLLTIMDKEIKMFDTELSKKITKKDAVFINKILDELRD